MSSSLPATSRRAPADALREAVWNAKAGDPLAAVTIITPSPYAAVATRRRLALGAQAPQLSAVAAVECTTLDHLARRLGAPVLARRGLRQVPAPVEAETVRALAAAGPGSWPRLGNHPRTLAALQGAFAELRRMAPADLETLAARPLRGADVVALLVAVRRHLHDHGFSDILDLRRAALSSVADAATAPGELGAIVVLEPAAPAPWEAELLTALARRTACTTIEATTGIATERWSCGDPEQEARTAVRLVLAGAEDGVPLWRQALLHPPGPGYARLLHQQLAAAAVPSNGPELRRLDRTSPGRALLGLLELAGGDFTRRQVLAWMASAPLRTGPAGRLLPVSRWNALSADAGVVRGRTQWAERLDRLAARQPVDADEARALGEFVEELGARTAERGRRWSERAQWAAGLLEHYVDRDETSWPEDQRLALAQVLELVRSMGELDAVSSTVDLAGFRRALRAELERHHLETTELAGGGVGDGVFVAPLSAGRAMRFDTVVVVGLADAEVPGRTGDDALLPDDLRAADLSGALRTRARRQTELLADLRAALGAGERRAVVTWPSVDPRSGRAQVPSRFLGALAPGAPLRRVPSLAASLAGDGPALSASELTLRAIGSWAAGGGDVTCSPPAQFDARLRTGFQAGAARAGRAFSRFDGLVGPGGVTPFDPARPVSATRLETYAECPRKFLFERVLGIHERTLPEDLWRIEGRDRGLMVHAVLERYVAERIAGAPRSLARLLEIADEHMDEAAAGGLVGKALLWRLDRAAIVRDLQLFHAEEEDLTPLAVELSFGDDDGAEPPVTVELADGRNVRFRGRADRVDRGRDGELLVSDYKTGKQRSIAKLEKSGDPLDGGRRLQLPLYAMAARQAFGPTDRVLARYWMVSAERAAASYRLEFDDALQRHFTDVVGRIARGIDQGCFPAIPGAPRENTFEGCMWCDFDRLCPATRDRQWAAKRGAPVLAPVDDLLAVEAAEPLSASLVKSGGTAGAGGARP